MRRRRWGPVLCVCDSRLSGGVKHAGVEFLYVLKGQLALRVAGEDYLLDGGDSVYCNSMRPHGCRRIGGKPCSALVVSVP